MKMLYISPWDMDLCGRFVGSAKKSIAIINAFRKYGIETDLYNTFIPYKEKRINKILSRLPFTPLGNSCIYQNSINNYDVYYFRFLVADYPTHKFLRKIRKANPNAVLLIEFPDIDYMSHYSNSIKNLPFFIKNYFFSHNLCKICDYAILMSPTQKEYKKLPVISVLNGIDLSLVTPIKGETNCKEVNIGFVGSIQSCHGVDILIDSVFAYVNGTVYKPIHVHIVGDGPILQDLKNKVNLLNLNNLFTFYGTQYGKQLDEIYEHIDVAISELAPFRRGYQFSSSLKSREYLGKGIPIVSAADIDVFYKEPVDFFYKIKVTNGLIDIFEIIKFYEDLLNNISKRELISRIRKYAESTVDIDKTILPIIDRLKGVD